MKAQLSVEDVLHTFHARPIFFYWQRDERTRLKAGVVIKNCLKISKFFGSLKDIFECFKHTIATAKRMQSKDLVVDAFKMSSGVKFTF